MAFGPFPGAQEASGFLEVGFIEGFAWDFRYDIAFHMCDFRVFGLFHVWFYCCVDLVFFHDGPVRWI